MPLKDPEKRREYNKKYAKKNKKKLNGQRKIYYQNNR
jgi:hypothetical protein